MNRNKILLPVMILIILLVGGIYLFSQQQPAKPQPQPNLPFPKVTNPIPTEDSVLLKLKQVYPGSEISKNNENTYIVFNPKTKDIKKFKYEKGNLKELTK